MFAVGHIDVAEMYRIVELEEYASYACTSLFCKTHFGVA
jgi:hypothetical protein